jgi:chemotaxis protein MotB
MGKDKKGSGSAWLTTYADFMSLMMIFFILIYTLTPGVEVAKWQQFILMFKGQSSIVEMQTSPGTAQSVDNQDRLEAFEELARMIGEADAQEDVIIEISEDFIKITLRESVSFNTYSSVLLPRAREILMVLSGIILQPQTRPTTRIEVHGHTDNIPIRANAPLYKSNWELGAARSISVISFMSEQGGLDPSLFVPSSFAEFDPVAPNDTDDGRSQNRRVEIYLRFDE